GPIRRGVGRRSPRSPLAPRRSAARFGHRSGGYHRHHRAGARGLARAGPSQRCVRAAHRDPVPVRDDVAPSVERTRPRGSEPMSALRDDHGLGAITTIVLLPLLVVVLAGVLQLGAIRVSVARVQAAADLATLIAVNDQADAVLP